MRLLTLLSLLLVLPLALVTSCIGEPIDALEEAAGEIMWEEEAHWGELYISDHCARSPECCTVTNEDLWDGGDDEFCEACPGEACQCVQGVDGVWMVDETVAGTDDPLTPLAEDE